MDKNEYSKEINVYVSDYIKFADAKGVTILTFIGLILSGMFSLVDPFLKNIDKVYSANSVYVVIGIICLTIALILAIQTVVEVFRALWPKTDVNTNSLNSFPYISKKDIADEYIHEMKNLKEDEIYLEYSKHNWEMSKICMDKHGHIRLAAKSFKKFLGFSATFVVLMILVKLIIFFQ